MTRVPLLSLLLAAKLPVSSFSLDHKHPTDVSYADAPKMPAKRTNLLPRARLPWMETKLVISNIASHSATNLCNSATSWGPDSLPLTKASSAICRPRLFTRSAQMRTSMVAWRSRAVRAMARRMRISLRWLCERFRLQSVLCLVPSGLMRRLLFGVATTDRMVHCLEISGGIWMGG
jgi:hypothetical protein